MTETTATKPTKLDAARAELAAVEAEIDALRGTLARRRAELARARAERDAAPGDPDAIRRVQDLQTAVKELTVLLPMPPNARDTPGQVVPVLQVKRDRAKEALERERQRRYHVLQDIARREELARTVSADLPAVLAAIHTVTAFCQKIEQAPPGVDLQTIHTWAGWVNRLQSDLDGLAGLRRQLALLGDDPDPWRPPRREHEPLTPAEIAAIEKRRERQSPVA